MLALLAHENSAIFFFDSEKVQEIVEAGKGADLGGRGVGKVSAESSERVPGAAHLAEDIQRHIL